MAASSGRPPGLDREGPVLKLMFGGGIYHYVSGALGNADVRGELLAARSCPAGVSSVTVSPSPCFSATISSSTG